ncbi:LysR family transcriptional regulator [Vulcaniibacterium tengchongense]|uniref:LysR family transcriptional regulator n=1 Tax=Vulcaniibacterium tengchongense TaxID=1273429 RepID=A0A3N4VW34_9GAMM|nr:LysR family transcriptional regulator [Vulcaniibacterium tengchongense]RPE77274.1 LysR family transcriptional regulator [Vulcaniibacterium tengchongense]
MDRFRAMQVFRSVAEARGFSAAAGRLGTTHSSVSRTVRQLETELGTRLVNRNTRRLTLTGAGERFYHACVEILDRFDGAMRSVAEEHRQPSGLLRVSVPLVVGTLELEGWLPGFLARYPDVRLELSCDDRFVEMGGSRFDVALRISEGIPDLPLVARRLAASERVLVASPSYVSRQGLPRSVAELAQHRMLRYRDDAGYEPPDGAGRGRTQAEPGLQVDTIAALHAAALAGIGIAAFTAKTVAGDIAGGRLLRVLPEHAFGVRHYYALYPHARHPPLKVRAFVEHMAEYYRAAP